MTEQDEKLPQTTDDAKSWLTVVKEFLAEFKEFVTAMRGWLALAMIIWAAINSHLNRGEIKDVKQIGNETKDVAVEAKKDAELAAVNAVEAKVVTSETRAAVTGDPKDIAAAKEAKAEAQAATQEVK